MVVRNLTPSIISPYYVIPRESVQVDIQTPEIPSE